MPGTACFRVVTLLLCRLGYPEKIKAWTVEPALEFQEKNYINLKADIDEDIQHLEKSTLHLEHDVDSLAEVVLQTR